ncbi:MAG: outer membrane beta-barrel protein [Bacteroidota bacterium]
MPRALLFVLLIVGGSAAAQVRVTGVVQDSTGGPLPGATVVLLQPADSVLVSFAATRADGVFELRSVRAGDYLLRATFVGFETSTEAVTVGREDLDLGTVTLAEATDELGELVVRSDRVPIVIRQDTLDYDAGAFRTPEGAVVEDLLRRLPGVEVEDDGSITAQGERVENVLVDGKEFFGDDPSIATRNLPADAVERVQVYDQASETAEFTGVDDGQEERTINLELKEDRKVGAFGNLSGGLGGTPTGSTGGPARPDALLFDTKATLNRFSPSTQLSLIANLNNVNRESFSVGDYFSFLGGPGAFARGGVLVLDGSNGVPVGSGDGDGFSTTLSGGLNANHDFNERTSIQSSYFLYRLDKERVQEVRREQFFGDGLASRLNEDGSGAEDRLLHRLTFNAEHEFSEGHDLSLESAFRYAGTDEGAATAREAFGTGGELQNESTTVTGQDAVNLGGEGTLRYRRRFESRRSLVAEAGLELGSRNIDGDLDATTQIYNLGDLLSSEEIAQLEDLQADEQTATASLLFTQPLSASDAIQVRGEVRQTGEDQDRSVFNRLTEEPLRIDSLSSAFDRTYRYAVGGVTYRRNREPVSLSVGLQTQVTDLGGTLAGVESDIGSRFVRFLPSATLSYAISDSRNAEVSYETSTREPTLRELQPVPDVRDPLRVYVGNPDLLPAYTHSVNARYLSFDPFTSTNLFVFTRASYSPTAISTARTVDANLRQSSTPINTSGTWTVNSSTNLGTLVRPLRSRVNARLSVLYNRAIETINGRDNASSLTRTSFNVSLSNQDNDVVDAEIGARLSWNTNAYSLNPELDRDFLNRSFSASLGWTPTDEWNLRTEFDLNVFSDAVPGGASETRSVPLWEASLSRSLMGGKTRVEMVAKDLLNRNLGVDYTSTAAYVQESRVNTLGRYVLLRLVYTVGSGRGGGFGR